MRILAWANNVMVLFPRTTANRLRELPGGVRMPAPGSSRSRFAVSEKSPCRGAARLHYHAGDTRRREGRVMANVLKTTWDRIHSLLGVSSATPDAALLDRYVTGRDESAFGEIVRRHGPMV